MSTINQLLADVYSDKKDRAIMDEFGNLRSLGGVHGNLLQVGRSQKHKYQKIKQ